MRVHLIHNPGAGDEEHSRDVLTNVIQKFGHDLAYFDAHSGWESEVQRLTPRDLVAVAGGDGTVARVGRALAGTGVPIAVLPLGTANNISGMLGVADLPIETLVAGWTRATRRALDIGVAHGPWGVFRFLESIGTGAFAQTIAEVAVGGAAHVDQLGNAEERITAALALIRSMIHREPAAPLEVVLDGHQLSGEFILSEVLNFGTAGPNLRLADDARPDDGLLDLVLVGEAERKTFADQLPRYRTEPRHAPGLPTYRAAHLRLRCESQVVHMDDRLWRGKGAIEIEVGVERGALLFLT